MTWAKLGAEFIDQCANAGLSDAAFRTHVEAISYLYRNDVTSCRVPKAVVARFAGSPDWKAGIDQLADVGFWKDRDDRWEVTHHGDVIRQSLAAQRDKRTQDRIRQQRKRAREAETTSADVTRDSAGVSRATQSVRQTGTKGTTDKHAHAHGSADGQKADP